MQVSACLRLAAMHVQSRTTNILPSSRRASSPAPPPCCLPSSPGPGRLFSLKLGWTRPGSSHFKEHAKGRHGVRASAAQATLEPAVRSLHTLPLRGSASLPEIPTDGRAGREMPARTSLPTPDANYERAIPRPGLPDTALLFPERRSNRGQSQPGPFALHGERGHFHVPIPSTARKVGVRVLTWARPGPPASQICFITCVDESDWRAFLELCLQHSCWSHLACSTCSQRTQDKSFLS